ncbi:MAG TPA: hypothetical protein VIM53_03010 [Candidatus Saccharimonadales bacterium]
MNADSNDSNDSNTTLAQIKEEIAVYLKERGWAKLEPRDLAISIVLEASELLEHFQWSDDQNIEAKRERIMHEFGDTLNYMLEFAMMMDFDVTSAWREKLALVKAKYPTSVFNEGKTHNNEAYQKIKQSYRANEKAGS